MPGAVIESPRGLNDATLGAFADVAKDADLDPDFAEKFLNFIIKEVIRHHEAIAADLGGKETAAS